MKEKKRIVILGAGYGGILTAKKLVKKFKKDEHVSITLIDKNNYHTMLTELHEVAAARVPEDAIRINLDKVFARRNVDIVLDEILDIDFESKVLKGKVDEYTYDYLVLGTGSKPTFYGCKGAEKHSFTLWSYEDAIRIKSHIWKMMGKASVETDPAKRASYLTFITIGCGFTGIEMIGELAEWRKSVCHTFNIDEKEVKLYVVDMLPKVLPMFKDKLIKKTEKRLNKMGVEILTSTNITEVKKDAVCIEGRGCIATHTSIWTAGVEGNDLIEKLDLEKKGRNRVETDSKLRSLKHENVFVVGDNIFFIPEGEEKPVPQMVENAEHSSATVAKNITATIKGHELKDYKPAFHGAMVSIGGRYGVAQVGSPKKQYTYSGFLAMLIKHLINFVYFLQIAGFNKLWTYMMHEFFHVRDRRSFVGGHFGKRSPNFWLVPLRLFLGVQWFIEGFVKLLRIIKDPTNIFLLPSKLEAVSGASVAEGAEEAIEAVSSASAAVAESVSQWGQALPVPEFISNIVDWSMNLIFYTSDGAFTGLAVVFQTLMILAEIVIGLCLVGGLFSALASVVSILLALMIWASGMAPPEILWFIFAGIATVGGSGSTFGMDYYVLPFLKKYWKKIPFVKKWYLYTDNHL